MNNESKKALKNVKYQTFSSMVKRNVKLFFKDKGMFFTALITPLILLVLYGTFLWNVYEESFLASLKEMGSSLDLKVIKGCVGGQLLSSLLAVSCITVAFCANMLMVQDKVNGVDKDFKITKVSGGMLAMAYYAATLICTLLISFAALAAGLAFIATKGWFFTVGDVLAIVADVVILTSFGTALSSLIGYFLSSQGQISAVGTVVSSAYGFICGAYMPISTFPLWLQKTLLFLPGTYGTSLLRRHCMGGTFREMGKSFPSEVMDAIKKSVDASIEFFGHTVSTGAAYAVLIGAVVLVVAAYCSVVIVGSKKKQKRTS